MEPVRGFKTLINSRWGGKNKMIRIYAEGKELKVVVPYKYPVSSWQTTFTNETESELLNITDKL